MPLLPVGAGVDPRIHRSPDDTDINLTEATLALHDWEEEERRKAEAIANRKSFEGLQIDPDIDFYPEVSDREPGDRNIVRAGFDIHPQVTFWASGFLVVFICLSIFVDATQDFFSEILDFINGSLGWFYILDFNIFLLVAMYFAFSRYGKIKLGGPFARPEFSTVSWYAMLLSAGLGIGLMFWGVAEPIFHFTSPAPLFGVEPGGIDAGKAALATTYLHWGIHGWALYGLTALALGFFAYNRGLPLTFRSIFYPILGPRIYGTWGHVIDILTVIATLFGLATSLGFGAQQAAAGLNKLFGLPDRSANQSHITGDRVQRTDLNGVARLHHDHTQRTVTQATDQPSTIGATPTATASRHDHRRHNHSAQPADDGRSGRVNRDLI